MTDVIKDFEEWYAKLPAPYKEDFMNSPALGEWAAKGFNAGHRACQQLNNNRIADLESTIRNMAAVIAKKDLYLGKIATEIVSIDKAEDAALEALAVTADGVELVEVGDLNIVGNEIGTGAIPYVEITNHSNLGKLYTIKQKD